MHLGITHFGDARILGRSPRLVPMQRIKDAFDSSAKNKNPPRRAMHLGITYFGDARILGRLSVKIVFSGHWLPFPPSEVRQATALQKV